VRHRVMGAPAARKPTEIDLPLLRQLFQLCHPDRHNGSPLSLKVFQRLQEIGKELDKATRPL
jgi:hypothetical protein